MMSDRPAISPPQATDHLVPPGRMTRQVEFIRERAHPAEDGPLYLHRRLANSQSSEMNLVRMLQLHQLYLLSAQ